VEQIQSVLGPNPSYANEPIKSAATLKQIRLYIGEETRNGELKTAHSKERTADMPIVTRYKPKRLTPYTTKVPLRYQGIELARYRKGAVLVEWKVAEGAMWEKLSDQVRGLAAMLASPAGKDSQSLLCLGYLPWEERELYALVYKIPSPTPQDAEDYWGVKTLRTLISEQPHLSLDRRFEIARTMAGVVLQLHTAGWLHKSLRSENVLFIAPQGSTPSEFLHTPPYLIGYEYARPDTAQGAMFTQLPDTELAADLYRHPKARGVGREKYRTQFDMYALGCILLEIGMWQCLLDIMTEYVDSGLDMRIKEAATLNKEIELPFFWELSSDQTPVRKLRHCIGDAFVEAVVACIDMDIPAEDASLDVQQAVVEKLQGCKY
jgi:hypothetical protein